MALTSLPLDASEGLLDPLDVDGLRPAFVDHPTTPSLIDGDVTPQSLAMTLATPDAPMSLLECPDDPIEYPPAPYLKDMDSFTEGTAQGSFDFSLDSLSTLSHHTSSAPHRTSGSVAVMPEDHPTPSFLDIQRWLHNVSSSDVGTDVEDLYVTTPAYLPTPANSPGAMQDNPGTVRPWRPGLKRHLSSAFDSVHDRQLALSIVSLPSVGARRAESDSISVGAARYRPRRRYLSPSEDIVMIDRPSSAPP